MKNNKDQQTITLIKWNKPFPYRTLCEMVSEDKIYEIFKNSLTFKEDKFNDIKQTLAKQFIAKYGKRYPYEQDTEILLSLIEQLSNTYLDTFFNNTIRNNIKGDYLDNLTKGNTLKYSTKSGSSASPYNIAFNEINVLDKNDYLQEKNLSETNQIQTNDDIVKRNKDIMVSKFSGEVVNFLNSFYSLFSTINLDSYIENELNYLLNCYKDILNTLIDKYNELLPTIEWIKEKGETNAR